MYPSLKSNFGKISNILKPTLKSNIKSRYQSEVYGLSSQQTTRKKSTINLLSLDNRGCRLVWNALNITFITITCLTKEPLLRCVTY